MRILILLYSIMVYSFLLMPFTAENDELLHKALENIKSNIPSIERTSDVTPLTLKKFPIFKIEETKSVIMREDLAKQIENSDFLFKEQLNNKRFIEIMYNDSYVTENGEESTSIGPCHSNLRSDTLTEVSRSWSASAANSVLAGLSVSQVFGISPLILLASDWGSKVSGSVSCIVGPRERLQFILYMDSIKLHGVKLRILSLQSRWKMLETIVFEEWEELVGATQIKRRPRTACITDPKYIQCN